MKRPITSYPCCLSIQAATDESTPPDIPTTTLDGLETGVAEELRWVIKKNARIQYKPKTPL
jgi:hypothetical protein